ncbi:MAG: 50S ribosome-binding GTPase, partial [Clostridia bacterium]|nr:50S ribosome-binding GTPase [Clostridia bacterium]
SLSGKVSSQINDIKEKLVEAAASIAFFADYPDEELPELNNQNFYKMLNVAHQSLNDMLSNFDAGKILREGVDTAIVGKPNVGKSTLMNLLSHKNRSIVTEIAGTTRDIIEDTVMVGDVMLNLADTAGIHKTDDVVESVGVKLAQEKKNTAQLILAVFDLSRQLDDNDLELLNSIKGKNAIVVLNKTDISGNVPQGVFEGFKTVLVSAKNGLGEQELVNAIAEITKVSSINPDSAVLGSERQRGCALRASSAISAAINALESGTTIDAVGVCIDDALAALYELTGERATNTVTNEIFKRFCVGK